MAWKPNRTLEGVFADDMGAIIGLWRGVEIFREMDSDGIFGNSFELGRIAPVRRVFFNESLEKPPKAQESPIGIALNAQAPGTDKALLSSYPLIERSLLERDGPLRSSTEGATKLLKPNLRISQVERTAGAQTVD